MFITRRWRIAVLVLLCASPVLAQTTTEELKRLSLQQLLDVQVTTVSRVPEDAIDVPAAVFVITQEDIRRSGAQSIPEALRLAPGLQVARINGGTWSIGIRGFADRLARSMLVLIDGRAVYSPLFAGTYWEVQDTLLSDVDRIEVIRGPGGTLWGANAVNGIINIITKSAADTQGLLASAGGGSDERATAAVRYGGTSGSLSYRAYAKTVDRGPEFNAAGPSYDGWRDVRGGFRADWQLAGNRSATIDSAIYDGRLGEQQSLSSYTPPFTTLSAVDAPVSGGHVLSRLSGQTVSQSEYQLQAYYDRTNRDEMPVGEQRDTIDVDFQQTFHPVGRHVPTWGAGYRLTSGRITATGTSSFTPATRTDSLFSAFVQDEIAIVPEQWRLTLGSKFEHNAYSGFEAQPSARVAWTPGDRHTVWGAVTRALRVPSRVETDYTTTTNVPVPGVPTFVRLLPDEAFAPEKLVAYEAGYRIRPAERVYLTVSTFYNSLHDVLSTDLLTPFVETSPPPVRVILPVDFANGLNGNSEGAELTADVRPVPRWRLTANYSWLTISTTKKPDGKDVSQEVHYETFSPHHQLQAGTSIDLGRWSVDVNVRHISELPRAVPAYTASDVRVGWRPLPHLELSIVGQDLFDAHHLEWPTSTGNVEIQRSVFARVTWRR